MNKVRGFAGKIPAWEQVGRSWKGGYARMMINFEHMKARMMGKYAGVRRKDENAGVRMGNITGR